MTVALLCSSTKQSYKFIKLQKSTILKKGKKKSLSGDMVDSKFSKKFDINSVDDF